jgi:hypothetical protein
MTMDVETKGQRILDARMEYEQLLSTYVSLANRFWVGYGAFFAINTLLATGLGSSYVTEAAKSLDPKFLTLVRILIPVTGMFISLVAIYVAWEIVKFQRLANKRGRELEKLLFARIFTELQPYSQRFPKGTTIGSLLFFVIWAGALYAAI